jgi:type IV secretion system protein VirD4
MPLKDNTERRIAIIIAAILGLSILLYLSGLFGQLNDNYQFWLSQGGMDGDVMIKPPDFNPLACIPYSFSSSGLRAMGLVSLIIISLFAYIKIHGKFGKGEYDDRNFKRATEGTYGTAAWMSDKEMKNVLEVTTVQEATGTILGEKNGKVICLPQDTRLNKHMFVCGATGTMKSRAVVRNLLFQSIKRGESVVLTDSKAELYDDTAELFRQNGYQVKVFNLINPEHGDSWNCMAELKGDTLTTQILTDIIISNTTKGKYDHFWDNGEGNLLKSLILYIDQDDRRGPEAKHLPAVYQFLTQTSEQQLSALFDRLPITHPAKAPFNLFAQASDTVRAGIVLGLGTRLQILQNEAIRRITSNSGIDLAQPGKTKCAYFVILSDQESSTEFLSSLFFSFMFIKLTRYADATREKRCDVPVNIIFEEFSNVGKLSLYPRRLSVARSRSLQICHIVQSLAQFQNRYPDNEWAEIIGSCDTQLMLGVTEKEGAEFYSLRSGDSTVRVGSTMTVKKTIAIAQMIPQYREMDGIGRRRLLTPDEILRFPNSELLIIIRGENVLRANKFDYSKHPYAKKLISLSIFDYKPKQEIIKPIHSQTKPESIETPQTENVDKFYATSKPPEEF